MVLSLLLGNVDDNDNNNDDNNDDDNNNSILYMSGFMKTVLKNRQVQKSDRINSDRQSGSDQLG